MTQLCFVLFFFYLFKYDSGCLCFVGYFLYYHFSALIDPQSPSPHSHLRKKQACLYQDNMSRKLPLEQMLIQMLLIRKAQGREADFIHPSCYSASEAGLSWHPKTQG